MTLWGGFLEVVFFFKFAASIFPLILPHIFTFVAKRNIGAQEIIDFGKLKIQKKMKQTGLGGHVDRSLGNAFFRIKIIFLLQYFGGTSPQVVILLKKI